jgi:hypothetical protein
MNCCRETAKMGVPARHREPSRSGEAGGPPGNRPALPRDWARSVPEWYVAGADTRGCLEGRPNYSRSLRSAQSRKRVPSFAVGAGDSWNIRASRLDL